MATISANNLKAALIAKLSKVQNRVKPEKSKSPESCKLLNRDARAAFKFAAYPQHSWVANPSFAA
jgi:hypothetical protein